jgi:hypothetical protein
MKKKDEQILVLTYWSYEDALIQAYTLPYLKIIQEILSPDSTIHLFTLEKNKGHSSNANPSSGIKRLSSIYHPFGFRGLFSWVFTFLRLLRYIKKNRISTIHCWCTPAGAAGYILSKFTGVRLILDSYEPHAQAMIENGTWRKKGLAYRILWYLEKKQTQKAFFVIGTTLGMKNYATVNYKVEIQNFLVKPACVDLAQFSLTKKKNPSLLRQFHLENKTICVYAGKFGGIYYKEEVFAFFKEARNFWAEKLHVLLLTSHSKEEVLTLVRKFDLPPEMFTILFVPHHEVADYIGLGDFALTPVKPVPSKRYCSPVKDGEYWAMGLPVVISEGISDDSDLIKTHKAGFVLPAMNEDAFRLALVSLQQLLTDDQQILASRIRDIADQYRNFQLAKAVYSSIYAR